MADDVATQAAGDNAQIIGFYETLIPLAKEYDAAKAALRANRGDPAVQARWSEAKHAYAAFRTAMRAAAGRPATGATAASTTATEG